MLESAAIATGARFLSPLIKDLYEGAKRFGTNGLSKWELRTFPRKLATRMLAIEQVRTLWKPDGPVSLNDFYHPPRIRLPGAKPKLATRLKDISEKNIILEGIVGQGKSIYLRSLAIAEYKNNDFQRLPVFIELRMLTSKYSLVQAIMRALDALDFSADDESQDYLFRSGKCCIFLDGFDELDEALTKETLEHISWLCIKYDMLQLVVTSRPGHEIQKIPLFEVVQIEPLSSVEYASFLQKLRVDSSKSQAIRAAIKESPSNISSLISTPLMMTLVVIVYEAEAKIPDSIPEFFDRLFQIVFSRHDHLKAGFSRKHYCGLSEGKLLELFEAFCFMVTQLGFGRTLSGEQFDEAFSHATAHVDGGSCDAEQFRMDITKVACLMLQEGLDTYTFLHKSILEYYAAAYVKNAIEENSIVFYNEMVSTSNGWLEVLQFLKSIDSYRYQKFYAARVALVLRKFVEDSTSLADKELPEYLERSFPGGFVFYRVSSDEKMVELAAIGQSHSPVFLEGGLPELLSRAANEVAPSKIELSEFIGYFGATTDTKISHGFGRPISFGRIFKTYGTDSLRSAIGILNSRADEIESKANVLVGSHQKKKLIFARPIKAKKN